MKLLQYRDELLRHRDENEIDVYKVGEKNILLILLSFYPLCYFQQTILKLS